MMCLKTAVPTEFRIINFIMLFTAISALVKCKKCDGNVLFQIASTRGLGFKIVVACNNCGNEYIPSCSFIGHSYEINRRFIFVMRIVQVLWPDGHAVFFR